MCHFLAYPETSEVLDVKEGLKIIGEEGFLFPSNREQMAASIRAQMSGGRCATAMVILEGVEGGAIITHLSQQFYQELGQPFAVFANEEDARRWLAEQLAQAAG